MAQPAGDMPQSFGHYDVESVLGRGAMGMVYLARDRRIGRRVALKTVHVNEKFEDESDAREYYKRLQREAELCGSLQHPNIVTLYEPGYENNVIAWMATEFVDGENLRDRLRRKKPLPLQEALRITEHILRGLAYAHAKGIVHRDIKPANILLTSTGDAKLADFGIARPQDSTLTAVGEMLGTPSYMSPEQVKTSPVTARSDLFSLGAVVYEMVTGLKAFAASDVTGILRNVVEGSPKAAHQVNSEVPQSLTAFINRLIAKNPQDRYPAAVEALDDLEKIESEVLSRSAPQEEVAKDVDDALTLSLRAQQQQQDHPTGATAPDFNDATPAVGSRPAEGLWSRPVPASVFWPVVLLAALAAGSGLYSIRSQTYSDSPAAYSPAQLRSFAAKKQALQNARALFRIGRMEDSLAAYDAYVTRYPESVVAPTERRVVASAIERAKLASSRMTVTAPDKSSRSEASKSQKEAPKKSIWRRIFGGGSKPEPKKP